MDCIHARLVMVLHSREAQELDASARAALDQHLEVCADCLAWSHQESRVDETIGAAVRNVPVPEALPSKILHQLEQRRPSRRGSWISAAAAALLLGASFGGYMWYAQNPEVSIEVVQRYVQISEILTAKDVENDFAEMSMPIKVPAEFNFDHYQGHMIADVQGRRVPRIDFFSPNEGQGNGTLAYAYIFARDRFHMVDVMSLPQDFGPIVTSKHRFETRNFPDHPGYVYVIVYTGSQPFFIRPPSA
jgi:hypothetical protein